MKKILIKKAEGKGLIFDSESLYFVSDSSASTICKKLNDENIENGISWVIKEAKPVDTLFIHKKIYMYHGIVKTKTL